MMQRFRIIPLLLRRQYSATTTTIDSNEIKQFQKFTSDWWDLAGSMKPLHSLNQIRVPFIRDGLVNTGAVGNGKIDTPTPLEGLTLLEVGCGGGILTEALARTGAKVTGIDAAEDLVSLAKRHSEKEKLTNISYVVTSIEEFAKSHTEQFDAVVASEVIEHVSAKEDFLKACVQCVKPKGSIFLTTLNKTIVSNIFAIHVAEKVLGLVPEGTHQYDKFLEPHKLRKMLENNNCKTELIHGMLYNFVTNSWNFCSNTSISYALHAFKMAV